MQLSHGSLSAKVEVSFGQCERLAALIEARPTPADREEAALPSLRPSEIGNFYLALVAICHQTSPQGLPPLEGIVQGQHLRGWDYLSARLEERVAQDPTTLCPDNWATLTPRGLADIFRDHDLGDRLTDPSGRAALLNDLGHVMLGHGWATADELFAVAEGCIAGGSSSLLALLPQFRAYDDPVRKKSLFFLTLMQNHGLWRYADPDSLGAPVDYHEVRGHLRLGTVVVRDRELREKLLCRLPVSAEEDLAIRAAVSAAIQRMVKLTGRSASRLHYLFWNVFRSCCTRDAPHCFACPPLCSLPLRYAEALHGSPQFPRACPYNSVCQSARATQRLTEHVFDTDYY